MPKLTFPLAVATLLIATALAPAVHADDFVDRVNKRFDPIKADRRSDLVILPVLATMDTPPKEVADPLRAALIIPASPNWAAAEAWATAKPQQDAIEALKKVTGEEDYRKAWAFAQPYGAPAVDPKFVDMGLYTELGEGATLASAEFKYLPAIRRLEMLSHIEATRLLAAGKGNDALDLMRRWTYLAHQIADRQFLKEKQAGLEMLILAFQRISDLAYTDAKADKQTMTPEMMRDTIAKLDEKRTPVAVERVGLPEADRDAAEQLIARTFSPGQGPNPALFARTYAAVASGNRPLRRFSESAKWDGIRPLHANTAETMKSFQDIFDNWALRWDMGNFDPILELPTTYQRIDKVRNAASDLVLGDVGNLFPLRSQARAEAVGARGALAVQGFRLLHHHSPPSLEGCVPAILQTTKILADPFDKSAKLAAPKRIAYIRPGVDTNGPVLIRVFPKVAGITFDNLNFEIKVNQDDFVLYSAGPDGLHNGMKLATQMVKDDKGDYLLWPPMISLVRQNLGETNKLP
jgi:hypothetical protein